MPTCCRSNELLFLIISCSSIKLSHSSDFCDNLSLISRSVSSFSCTCFCRFITISVNILGSFGSSGFELVLPFVCATRRKHFIYRTISVTIALKYKTGTKIADFFVGFLYFLIYTGLFLSPHFDWSDELILFVVNILAQISFISKLYAVICLP